jgi:pimeloyl-ACP methyl ester carboxylesterase
VAGLNPDSMKVLMMILILSLASVVNSLGQEGFVSINETLKLHYNIVGSGRDTLVVPDGAWQLPYYVKYGNGLTFIIYDCRNRGYSGNSDDVGIDFDVSDLESVRKHFKIKKMNAIGWSYLGAMVALHASKYPENVNSIIQVGAMPHKRAPYFDPYLKSSRERRSAELDQELTALGATDNSKTDPQTFCSKFYEASVYAMISEQKKATDITAKVPCNCPNEQPQNISKILGKVFGNLGNWDFTSQLASLRSDMLVIHGIDDNIPLESSKEWAALNPKSKLVMFNSSGHLPFAEEPEMFFKVIGGFVGSDGRR